MTDVRLGRFGGKESATRDDDEGPFIARLGFSLGKFASEIVFDGVLVVSDTALNVARVALANLPILVLFWVTFVASTIVLLRNRDVVYVVDTTYEALRPTYVETLLQVVNFARVLYALFVGVWNAAIDVLLVPIKVLFDSAFRCGGADFVRDVALAISNIARALALSTRDFFVRLYEDKTLDVDVTEVVRTSRLFLQEFAQVIECACESISAPTVRAAAYPLYSPTTDVFVNNATRAIVKTLEIPYVAATTGSTSFAPLFDVILSEEDGVLASGAKLANEYLKEVVEFVQVPVPRDARFDSPPVFSLVHRSVAVFAEIARGIVDTVAELPTITRGDGPTVADVVHESATANRVKFNANQFAGVLFGDTLVALHPYFQEYGEALTLGFETVTEFLELTYNSTLDAVTGVSSPDATPFAGARDYSKGVGECESHIAYSDAVVGRPRMAINLWVKKYSSRVVPLQIAFLEKARDIIAFKFFSVAFADSALAVWLAVVRTIESVLRLTSYLTDSLLRFDYVSRLCTDAFTADVWEKADDFLTSLPNVVTSLASFDDTYESGYSNIACARTTHVDHVYSGSLKAYVFASRACRVRYDETLSTPKCPYRDDDPTVQAALCEKLTAFAEYNTNPLCNGGDTYVEVVRSFVLVFRTFADYNLGMLVGVWNCMIDAGNLDFAGCAESLSGEIVPSRAVFDLAECQTAELIYRTSATVVSVFTPLFDAMYAKSGYPKNGFYTRGIDDLQHAQARPFEAAFSTVLTSVGGIFFYPVHVLAELGRDVSTMIEETTTGSFDIAKMFAYRKTFVVVQVRSLILFFRDLIVALTQFARAVDTVAHYEESLKVDPSPDPRRTSSEFLAFQKTVGDVLDLVQSIGELLSETFVEGVEAFFEMIFFLLEALMKAALGDGSAGESLQAFFETFVDKLGSLVSNFIEGIFVFLVRKPEGGIPNPFRILFCDVLGALKNGVCDVMTTKIIPKSMSINCVGRDGCVWLPEGELSFFSTESFSPVSMPDLDARVNPGASAETTVRDSSAYEPDFDGVGGEDRTNELERVSAKEFVRMLTVVRKTGKLPSYDGRTLTVTEACYLVERFATDLKTGIKDAIDDFLGCDGKRRRRRLLGGDEFKESVKKIVDPIVRPVNDLANKAKDLANEAKEFADDVKNKAKDAANKAINYAKEAVSDVVDAANAAANVANDLWDWVEDLAKLIEGSIPDVSRWKTSSASIAEVAGLQATVNGVMGCTERGIAQCDASAYEIPARQEPTVCSSEIECHATDAYCWTPDASACLSTDFVAEGGEEWAKSCRCDLLAGNKYHCNYATGYCEMGATPFAPPLDECSSSGGLVSGSDGHDRLCFVSPVWKCAGHPDPEHCRALVGTETLPLQGPSLCRSFCAPTWENRNNRLAQLVFADGTRKCACEVGFDRAFPTADPSTTTASVVNVPVTYQVAKNGASGVTGRRKLASTDVNRVRPFTKCDSTSRCTPSFESPTVCRSLWGDPTPCYSCSERVHGDKRGYACDAEEKECACTVDRDADVDEETVVDVGEWRGNAWCDKIMRGYKTAAVRSPLERAWIHRCTVYKIVGQRITSILGVPSVPPDLLYNPGRLLSVLGDAVQGLHVYYSEGFNTRDADVRVAFFDRLVEKRVDPLVTFAFLGAIDTAFNVGRIVYSKIDIFTVAKTLLHATDERAEAAFVRGTSLASAEFKKVHDAATSRDVDYAGLFAGTTSLVAKATRLVVDATREVTENATTTNARTTKIANATTTPTTNATISNTTTNANATTIAITAPVRALLQVGECEVITNVRERASAIASTLTRYYGSEDEFLSASLCAYETFLTREETCPFPNGQASENGTTISLTNPFSFIVGGGGGSSSTITADSVVRFLLGAADRAIRDLDDANDVIVRKIVEASESASGTVSRCSSDILLCERRKMSIANAAWIAESWAVVIFLSFKLVGITSVGLGAFLAAQMTVIPSAVLSMAYGYSVSCLPRLPVCVMDDFFAILRAMFPAHVDWSGLVTNPERTRHPEFSWLHTLEGGDARIVDCRDQGFDDQLDSYFWLSGKIGPGGEAITAIVDWPLVTLWSRARRKRAKWRDIERTPLVDDCGNLVTVGAIPIVVLSLVFYVVVSFATVPCIRTGANALARAKETVVYFFVAALALYNH